MGRRILLQRMGLRRRGLEGQGLELWRSAGAVGWCRGGVGHAVAVAHAAGWSVISGLGTALGLAEAPLVLRVWLLLLLCGWWRTALVEAWACGAHWGLLWWGASCGAGSALTGVEGTESLRGLGLSLR